MNTIKQISVVVRHIDVPIDSALYGLSDLEVCSPKIATDMVRIIMGPMDQEYVCSLPVDASNKILGVHLVHLGTVESCSMDPRSIMRAAIVLGASGVIVAHNHPANQMEPSECDINVTKRMQEVGLIVGVNLIDHVIVGMDSYYSFAESGMLF